MKRALVENGITRLCIFFGRQKANEVVLSHMITFLNDKVIHSVLLVQVSIDQSQNVIWFIFD